METPTSTSAWRDLPGMLKGGIPAALAPRALPRGVGQSALVGAGLLALFRLTRKGS